MAKKGLAALATKQINSTSQPSQTAKEEVGNAIVGMAEMADEYGREEALNTYGISEEKEEELNEKTKDILRKVGRPSATTAPDEVAVTFKISASLLQEIKIKAVMEHSTQKEIVNAALRQYLNK